jgi:hypothetical protein
MLTETLLMQIRILASDPYLRLRALDADPGGPKNILIL